MAMGNGLKQVYRDLEASPEEMARYRGRLAERLAAKSPAGNAPPWMWLAAVAALLMAAILMPWNRSGFHGDSLEALQMMVSTADDPGALEIRAKRALREGDRQDRLNAAVVLCLLEPPQAVIPLAARSVAAEDRPVFRAFYLEYLLDFGDEWPWNPAEIEKLMEDEEDPLCLALFRQWLKIS